MLRLDKATYLSRNTLFDGFRLASFQMYYLYLLVQKLLAMSEAFV